MNSAFLSKGRLYLLSENGKAEEVRSEFADKQEREAERRRSYSPWEREEGAANAFGGINVWGGRAGAARFERYAFSDILRLDGNTLLYTLTNGTVTGLFEYDVREKTERRLVHRNDFRFEGMDCDPGSRELCVGRAREDGSVNIERIDLAGRTLKQITEGDSVDSFPSFSLMSPTRLLFQSSGIARMGNGAFHSLGSACINRLDLNTGEMSEVMGNDSCDFLMPKEDREGAVFCIRRPVQSFKRPPFWRSLIEFMMFPLLFVQALYNFLKVFTDLFKNQPAIADGPRIQPPQQGQHIRILGQTIDLGKAIAGKKGEDPTLVPGDWELVRLVDGKAPEVLARHVCAFDIDGTGTVTYTNGFKISTVKSGTPSSLGTFELVERLRCLT